MKRKRRGLGLIIAGLGVLAIALAVLLSSCAPTPAPAAFAQPPAQPVSAAETACSPETGGTYTFRSKSGEAVVATARQCFGKGENACDKQNMGMEFSVTLTEVSYLNYKYYFHQGNTEFYIRIGDVECVGVP